MTPPPTDALRALALAACCAAMPAAHAVVLTGEVQSVGAQALITPFSNSSPVVIRYFVPEGEAVKAGHVVLRIDPGQSASQVVELDAQIEQAQAKTGKEVAELEVKAVEAELALVDAEAELAKARLDAGIPKEMISALDHDRYRGELDRTTREAALKRNELADARAAVTRRGASGRLEVEKLSLQRDYHAAQVRASELRAERDGIVIHGFNNNWIGGRIDEGSSTMPGSRAGEIVGAGGARMRVRAWALEPDRRGLRKGQTVQLSFDALPGRHATGTIAAIAGAPEQRPAWGEGRYFAVDIDFDQRGLALLPGMSVRVIATPRRPAASGAKAAAR